MQAGLMQEGTLVVADNVLWAGAVPRYAQQLAENGDADAAAAPLYRGISMSRQEKVSVLTCCARCARYQRYAHTIAYNPFEFQCP